MSTDESVRSKARDLVERLPESASWDDLMYEIYVRQAIEAGISDADAGRTIPHDQVKARLRAMLHTAHGGDHRIRDDSLRAA